GRTLGSRRPAEEWRYSFRVDDDSPGLAQLRRCGGASAFSAGGGARRRRGLGGARPGAGGAGGVAGGTGGRPRAGAGARGGAGGLSGPSGAVLARHGLLESAANDPAGAAGVLELQLQGQGAAEPDGPLALAELSYLAGLEREASEPAVALAWYRDAAVLAAL